MHTQIEILDNASSLRQYFLYQAVERERERERERELDHNGNGMDTYLHAIIVLVFYILMWREISQEYKNNASYHQVLSLYPEFSKK